ncbi:malto-oligosyltrehalose synthase [Streptomyces tsukubensis]|uniref:Malto-oligosyltrehalose synthase n=1 Tax=Streptomyces tsukubensis TaxID=83656 RepID=A0A1V4AB98_9ACTN|nr:malto-oligosyltrehalose synthase [Streptomyces tsukubensis]
MGGDGLAPPTATYRLQLTPDFPFAAAEAAVPYLASLGVSHLHLSPVLDAVPGSAHGYDVVDHTRIRGELGGPAGLRALSRTARAHGLGLVVDIVPNHMAAAPRFNRALWNVLREGPKSPYARWFDIDWEAGGGRVLLPVLGGRLGDEGENLRVEDGELRYYEHAFPLREGTQGLPLPRLVDAQWYRLGWWRLARTELNYRRFFTISELIGLRVEDPEVFEATHAVLLGLLAEGVVEGVRVDHPDGLADPGGYLRRLARRVGEVTGGGARWTVVEKILADGERLPAGWPVAGTTGYDALRHIDGVFIDPAGAGELIGQYRRFAAPAHDRGGEWEATVRRAAYRVVTHELAAEVETLVRIAGRVCADGTARRDHAPWAVRTALRELLVRVPVYRPYASEGEPDAEVLTAEAARQAAMAFTVPQEADAVTLVRELALGLLGDGPDHRAFRDRFAQTASALRAKSVEDTAFYRYTPLLSASEVGGDPSGPAVRPATFHAYCARLQQDWPLTGTVLSTHDTKRSADVRAATAVITERPQYWADFLSDVTKATASGGTGSPDPQFVWAAWQAAVGFGLPDAERLGDALLKHAREAGLHTSWTEQDAVYEKAVKDFMAAGPGGRPGSEVAVFNREMGPYIRANVLGAALLHLTMPGVPDVYQGTESEVRTLVDPDNRRTPPDLRATLSSLDGGAAPTGLGEEKTALTAAALRLRRARPGLFGPGASYDPLPASGRAAPHCLAFSRSGGAVTAVTRLSARLADSGGWQGTTLPLPEGRWRTVLPGEEREFTGRASLEELFTVWPAVLLVREE